MLSAKQVGKVLAVDFLPVVFGQSRAGYAVSAVPNCSFIEYLPSVPQDRIRLLRAAM